MQIYKFWDTYQNNSVQFYLPPIDLIGQVKAHLEAEMKL